MPFAFKLAGRLARLKHRTLAGAAAAVAAAALLSCELPKRVAAPNATVSQLIITPHAVTLQLNQDQDFVAVGLSAAGDTTPSTVSWDVTGGTITDMGASGGRHYGQYHGGTCGTFKVAATSHPDRTTDTATVTVAGCVAPVAAVTVSPAAPTVQVGQTAQLTATPKDANGTPLPGRVVTWSSNNTSVATVDAGGLVTAVAVGAATITATSEGQSGTAVVTVSNVPVASVTVSPVSASVQQGATVQLTATPRDASGNPLTGRVITWQSSNSAIASVNGSGLVSGVAAGGPVTMTATSEGQSGTASITVSGVPVASVTVSPASASVPAGQTVQLSATLRDANGTILTGRSVTWASTNTPVATVTGTGLVSAKVAGSATITATSEGQSGTAAITVTPSTGAQFDHVFIVLEENTDYSSVTSSSMPYLTGLAAQYGLATQYYANTHPSIGNYLDMTSGTVLTNDDSYSGSPFNVPNVFRSLIAAGKSWKGYAEDLPSTGFVDYTQIEVGQFASRHFPPIYYTDVHDNPAQAQNVVPFTQFATDLANGTLPDYSFIVPNLCNDAHDCSLNTADSWLQQNIDPLVRSAFFQQNNCLLIITFDEAGGDNTNGGGQVYWVAVSPTKSKRGYVSTTLYQHQSTLRLMLKGLGVTSFPSDAATAPDMSEFFTP